uniref:Uncharacterized protein n=1 Tax=Echeneis naucrates TaxID=173247 RepID=A0A665TSW8_ECHNA
MADPHRTNALVTSCLKTPVDPNTKAPLASYERRRVLPCSAAAPPDNRDSEKEVKSQKAIWGLILPSQQTADSFRSVCVEEGI